MLAGTSSYNYNTFLDRDDQAVDFFEPQGVPIVDLRMLYARSDAHVSSRKNLRKGEVQDCLHLCLKTTALFETFPRMLMHVLLR